MEYIYSVMLLNKSGTEVNEANMKKVLEAAGVKVDTAKIKSVISAIEGVDIDEVIAKAGQSVMSAPVVSSNNNGGDNKPAAKVEKKQEAPVEDSAAGLGSLF